jgi:hypothetical protein
MKIWPTSFSFVISFQSFYLREEVSASPYYYLCDDLKNDTLIAAQFSAITVYPADLDEDGSISLKLKVMVLSPSNITE